MVRIEHSFRSKCRIAKAHGLDQLQYVILEMSPVTRIDAMGITFLEELLNDYRKRGIQLVSLPRV